MPSNTYSITQEKIKSVSTENDMITDLTTSIICVCPECSRVNRKKISAFDFPKGKVTSILCDSPECKCNILSFSHYKDRYKIDIECPVCGETHIYKVTQKKFWEKDLFILNCPELSFGSLFAGKDEKRLAEEFAFQNDLMNGLIAANNNSDENDLYLLFDTVEKINELARNKKIKCSCEKNRITIGIDVNTVSLKCDNCGKTLVLPVSEETLETLSQNPDITIE